MPDRFLIVDDHPLFRDALQSTIRLEFPEAEIVEANSIDAAHRELERNADFELLMLDLSMPGTKGFEGLLGLRAAHPRIPIVIVSGIEDSRVVGEAMACGVAGFIPKSIRKPELAGAIRAVMNGAVYLPAWFTPHSPEKAAGKHDDLVRRLRSLTPQQLRVLSLIRQGKLNKQIAHELQVGETTAKAHVSEILRKLNVHSRTMAVTEVSKIDFASLGITEGTLVR